MNPILQHSRRLITNCSPPKPYVKTPERSISTNVMVAVMVTLLCIWLIYLICRYMVRPLICRYIVTFRSPQPPPVPSHGDELITALLMFIYGVDLDSACCSCVALEEKGAMCAICLAEFVHGDEVRFFLTCTHMYHRSCIYRWVVLKSLCCPTCRDLELITTHLTFCERCDPAMAFVIFMVCWIIVDGLIIQLKY